MKGGPLSVCEHPFATVIFFRWFENHQLWRRCHGFLGKNNTTYFVDEPTIKNIEVKNVVYVDFTPCFQWTIDRGKPLSLVGFP